MANGQVQGVPPGLTAEPVEGVPPGLTAEPVEQVSGVPSGLTAEPVKRPEPTPEESAAKAGVPVEQAKPGAFQVKPGGPTMHPRFDWNASLDEIEAHFQMNPDEAQQFRSRAADVVRMAGPVIGGAIGMTGGAAAGGIGAVPGTAVGTTLGHAGGEYLGNIIEGRPRPNTLGVVTRSGQAGAETLLYGKLLSQLHGIAGDVTKWLRGPAATEAQLMNKRIGVTKKEIRLGKGVSKIDAPRAEGGPVTQPGRGLVKVGYTDEQLAKMNPLERNNAMDLHLDEAGKSLDAILEEAGTQGGVRMNLGKPLDDVVQNIGDDSVRKTVQNKLLQAQKELGIVDRDNITPMQARELERKINKFAFGSGTPGAVREVTQDMRRVISQETRRLVPKAAPMDELYSDLHHAKVATDRAAKEFVRLPQPAAWKAWLSNPLVRRGIEGAFAGAGFTGAGAAVHKMLEKLLTSSNIPIPPEGATHIVHNNGKVIGWSADGKNMLGGLGEEG